MIGLKQIHAIHIQIFEKKQPKTPVSILWSSIVPSQHHLNQPKAIYTNDIDHYS